MSDPTAFRSIPQDEENNVAGRISRSEHPSTVWQRMLQVSAVLFVLILIVGSTVLKGGNPKVDIDSNTEENVDSVSKSQWPPTLVTPDMFASPNIDTERAEVIFDSTRILPGTYISSIDMETDSELQIGGVNLPSNINMKLEMEMDVDEVHDGYFNVDMLVTKLQMSGSQMGVSLEYDSDNDNNDPILDKELQGIVGSETKVSHVSFHFNH